MINDSQKYLIKSKPHHLYSLIKNFALQNINSNPNHTLRCVKYARIMILFDLYYPVKGQNQRFLPHIRKYRKPVFWHISRSTRLKYIPLKP